MKLRDILREELASFAIDDTPGRGGFVGAPARREPVGRAGHERDNVNKWRAGLEQNPDAKNWAIVTASGKRLHQGLRKADAETLVANRRDLTAKFGPLKVVYEPF